MRLLSYFIWPLAFIGQLLAISLLAWHLLALINFAYPMGYKLLNMDKHIAEFAPLNRHIHSFEFTQPEDHWKLFAQITHAVQHSGEGLADIRFNLPNNISIPLMHEAEIIHLQDVSHLIDQFYVAGYLGGFVWIVFLFFAYRKKMVFPSLRKIGLGFCIGLMAIATLIISLGATKIFYWLHTKIFPDGHQWFFYYEDSLMTTLMKAPDIFAFIAALLFAVLIILWGLSTWAMSRLLSYPENNLSYPKDKLTQHPSKHKKPIQKTTAKPKIKQN